MPRRMLTLLYQQREAERRQAEFDRLERERLRRMVQELVARRQLYSSRERLG